MHGANACNHQFKRLVHGNCNYLVNFGKCDWRKSLPSYKAKPTKNFGVKAS